MMLSLQVVLDTRAKQFNVLDVVMSMVRLRSNENGAGCCQTVQIKLCFGCLFTLIISVAPFVLLLFF